MLIGQYSLSGQCETYDYIFRHQYFSCEYTSGQICFGSSADHVDPVNDCAEYVVEIEFPVGSFQYTDLQDFSVVSSPPGIVILRSPILIGYDIITEVCLEGLLHFSNTAFTLRVVHPTTNHVVTSQVFYLDDEQEVGSSGVTTTISQAIIDMDLLNANDAATTPQNVILEGTLLVDQNYTFAPGSTITAKAGSSIEILGSNHLSVLRSRIFTCNDMKWTGIIVNQNATLSLISSSIENANTAIEMKNLSGCYIKGSEFENNDVGIGSYGQNYKDINLIFGGSFYGTGSSISGGQYGLKLEHTSDIFIGGGAAFFHTLNTAIFIDNTNFSSSTLFMQDCYRGIHAIEAPEFITLVKNFYTDVDWGVHVDGAPMCSIKESAFSGGLVAFYRKSKAIDEVTEFMNNNIYSYRYGIRGSLKQSWGNIMNNNMDCYFNNISLFGNEGNQKWSVQYNTSMNILSNSPYAKNIRFQNIHNGRIFKNNSIGAKNNSTLISGGTFNNIGYNFFFNQGNGYGIEIENSDMASLYCNEIYGDNTTGIQVSSNNSGSDIRGNDMINTDLGLQYGMSNQTFAHTGEQPYKGNKFKNSTSSNPQAINYSPWNIAQLNQYLVSKQAGVQGSTLYPYFTSSFDKWFDIEGNTYDYECPPGILKLKDWNLAEYEGLIQEEINLIGRIDQEYGNIGILVDAKMKIIEHILRYQEKGGTLFDNILQNSAYQDVLFLATQKHEFNKLVSTIVMTDYQAQEWVQDMSELTDSIAKYELISVDSVSLQVSTHFSDLEYLALVGELDTMKNRFSSLIATKQLQVDSIVSAQLNQFGTTSISSSEYIDYYQNLLSFTLKYHHSTFSGFSPSEQSVIETIADKCLYQFPDPVVLARSLRMTYDTMNYYSDNCSEEIPVELRTTISEGIKLYPNPATQSITIEVVEEDKGEVTFNLFNSMGEIVKTVTVENSQEVDVANLNPGIYFLMDISGNHKNVKFLIFD